MIENVAYKDAHPQVCNSNATYCTMSIIYDVTNKSKLVFMQSKEDGENVSKEKRTNNFLGLNLKLSSLVIVNAARIPF